MSRALWWFDCMEYITMAIKEEVYFERQGGLSLQCGRHSVNHLLGGPVFSAEDMNQLCYQLSDSFINPHKHLFGGDYDVNVLMLALQQHSLNTLWFDKRLPSLSVPKPSAQPSVVGYLVNVHTGASVILSACSFSRRHWFAVRRRGEVYYWLDSKEEEPVVRSAEETEVELNRLMRVADDQEQAEVLVVCKNN